MKAIYVISFLGLLIFYSCKKDSGPTSVEGRVLEAGSNKAIPYAEVYLTREKAEFFSSALDIATIQTIKADGNGKFSFHFEADADYIYGVNAQAEGYNYSSGSYVSLERGSKNKKDILLNGYGYLKYHIKNVTKKYRIGINTYCFKSSYFSESTDTIIFCQELGNKTYPLIYRLYSIKDTTVYSKDIYIPSRDTAFVEIFY